MKSTILVTAGLVIFIVISAYTKYANAICPDDDLIYQCSAPDEESEDLTCDCHYFEGSGYYNCTCYANPQEEREEVYLSCEDAFIKGQTEDGIYTIKPDHLDPFQVYCEMEEGGWTLLQQRMDGSVNFSRTWSDCVHGFGNLTGEFWLGLSKIHRLANSSSTPQLRVDLEDFSQNKAYAVYDTFYIEGSKTDYTLHVSGYNGTARDAMYYNNGAKFSTSDDDNDYYSSVNCAVYYGGPWWHKSCSYANLNAIYYAYSRYGSDGVTWYQWKGGWYALKSTSMKIKTSD